MRLAMRNRIYLFFSLVVPLGYLFLMVCVFAKGDPMKVLYLMGPVVSLTVMGSFWGLSMQLVMFREQGILRRFRLAPVGAGALLASSIIATYFLILPPVLTEFLVARLILKMPNLGNILGVFLLITLGTATFSGLGLIVASVANTMQETQVINNILWSLCLFLSGAAFPLVFLPIHVQRLALFLPGTYLVEGLQGALLRRASAAHLASNLLVLAVCLFVSFEISRQLFRWEPEAKAPRRAKLWVLMALVPFLLMGIWENAYGKRLRDIQQNYISAFQTAFRSHTK